MSNDNLLDIPDDQIDEFVRQMENSPTDDEPDTEEPEQEEDTNVEAEASTDDSDEAEEPTEDDNAEEVEEGESDDLDDSEASEDVIEDVTEDDETDAVEEKDVQEDSSDIDYKKEYERILAPFNANGKTIQVDSIDDAIRLMQMGANYNKNMADLKPVKRINKLLENNDLLDETKLSTLIEVSKGNKEAIKKIVADNGLDPYELDAEEDRKYEVPKHTVNDSEIELDSVLGEIRNTPSFSKTVDVITNQLDAKSKADIMNNPSILRVLHSDVETGRYDSVSSEVAKLRALGKIPSNVSDLDAYGHIASNMFSQPQQVNPQTQVKTELPSQQKQNNDDRAKAQRKAAAPTRKSVSKSKAPVDVLNLSDAEFDKLAQDGLFKTV